jgi:hypothetical protein
LCRDDPMQIQGNPSIWGWWFFIVMWAWIMASATQELSGLPHGSPQRIEGRWRSLDVC